MKKGELLRRVQERHYADMEPCPGCGSKNLLPQTPIKMDEEVDLTAEDAARKMLGAYARTMQWTGGLLEGPCYFMCRDCGYKGDAVDCSGRTSPDVGKDPVVYRQMKEKWNQSVKANPGASNGHL